MSDDMELFGGHRLRRVWMEGRGRGSDLLTSQKMAVRHMISHASSIRLISTTSLEGFIFVVNVNDERHCPFETVRDMDLLGYPGITTEVVKSILIKVGLFMPGNAPAIGIDIPRAGNQYEGDGNFMVSNADNVSTEIETQRQLYKRTLVESVSRPDDQESGVILFEPVCPNLLAAFTDTIGEDRNTYNHLMDLIARKLRERPYIPLGDPNYHEADDRTAIGHLLNSQYSKYIIAMEFFDGAVTLEERMNANMNDVPRLTSIHRYQLTRMRNAIGRIHTDAHFGNVLYIPPRNLSAGMFRDRQDLSRERIMLIDFGRTEEVNPIAAAAAPIPPVLHNNAQRLMNNMRRMMGRQPRAQPLIPIPPIVVEPVGRINENMIQSPDEAVILQYEQESFARSQLFMKALLDMPEYNQDIGLMIFGIMIATSNFGDRAATEIAERVFANYVVEHGEPRGVDQMRHGLNMMRRAEANAPGLARRVFDVAVPVAEGIGALFAVYELIRTTGLIGGGLVGGSKRMDDDLSTFIQLLNDALKKDKRTAMKLLSGVMGVDVNSKSTGAKTELSDDILINISYTFLSAYSPMDLKSQSLSSTVNKKKFTRKLKSASRPKSARRRKSLSRSKSASRSKSIQTLITQN